MASDPSRKTKWNSSQKSSKMSREMAASVDRLSQPKHKHVHHAQSKQSDQQHVSKSRNELELTDFPVEAMDLTPRSSMESLNDGLASKPRIKRSLSSINQLEVSSNRLTSSTQTNLSREMAASVERLSRPKSRKRAMHQNRLSLNLDEQWKSLEEACQSNLQVTSLERSQFGASALSSSRESIGSQSTNASFGSRSSLFGSRGISQSARFRGTESLEPPNGRRKARSERLLASMDSLNLVMNARGFSGSKSLSPTRPSSATIAKSRTVSVDRLPVMSRLMLPTVSSSLKHRVSSETKLSRAPSNVSLSSKTSKDGKSQAKNVERGSDSKSKKRFSFEAKTKSPAGTSIGILI